MRNLVTASFTLAFLVAIALSSSAQAQVIAEINPTYPEASSGGGTNAGYPVNTYYHDQRMECIYTVSELTAAGLYPGALINQVQLKTSELPARVVENFRIRMGHIVASTHPSTFHQASSFTLHHGPTTYQISDFAVNQWKTYTFSTPFAWNGTSNLLIDFTTDGTDWVSGGGIFLRTTPALRHFRGWTDSGFTYPFDTMSFTGSGNSVPSIRLGFPPPQLTVYLNNPPNPRENIPYSATATALESPAFLPYTYTLTPLVNASWLTINPTTGELTGTPPAFSAGNVTFQITVANSRPAGVQTDTKSFALTIIGIPNLVPQYLDNFNTPSLVEQYDIILNPKAEAAYKAAAASGGTGFGLRLSSNQSTGLFTPVDVGNAAHRAVLDNPAQWEGGGVIDPSEFVGKAELITRAPGVFNVEVSFQYRIVQTGQQPSVAHAAYQNNMVFEWSNDGGLNWNIASGPTALPNGIYRTPTTGTAFVNEAFTISGLSGAANQMIRFRLRWLCRLKDDPQSIQTYIDVDNLSLVVPFTVTTLGIPSATATIPYSYENGNIQLVQVSGIPPVTWSATGAPSWMNINPSTGVITGKPGLADVGTVNLTINATDSTTAVANRPLTFDVKPAPSPVAITNLATLPEASEGVLYQYTLSAFGGAPIPAGPPAPRYFWSITTDANSSWLSVDANTGLLTGTPPLGSFGTTVSFSATVRDGLFLLPDGTAANTATKTFFMSIVERLTITTTTLDLATQGTTFRPMLTAAGGVEPYTWTLLSGQLPNGLSLEPTTGRIYGVPLTTQPANQYNLVLQVSDAGIQSEIVNLTLFVQPAASTTNLQILTQSLSPSVATETRPFETWLDASGGVPPYTFTFNTSSSTDSLPPGLSLDASGRISGSPFAGTARPYLIEFRITDSSPVPQTFDRTLGITVESLVLPPTIITSVLQVAEVGLAYPANNPFPPPNINAPALRVSGGVPPFEWELLSGTLPSGVVFTSVGVITGVPLAGSDSPGVYPLTVRVIDGNLNSDTRSFELIVNAYSGPQLNFVASTFPAATVGSSYSFRVTATGGANPTGSTLPYTFRRVSGQLPAGLDFDTFGQVRGIPAVGQSGEYPLVLEVRDAAGFTAQTTMVLSVVDIGGGGSLNLGAGATPPVTLDGSGSGCSVGGSGPSGAVWLIVLSTLAGMVLLRRRRA